MSLEYYLIPDMLGGITAQAKRLGFLGFLNMLKFKRLPVVGTAVKLYSGSPPYLKKACVAQSDT